MSMEILTHPGHGQGLRVLLGNSCPVGGSTYEWCNIRVSLFFAMLLDRLTNEVRQESPCTMKFADDIVTCDKSREQMEEKGGGQQSKGYRGQGLFMTDEQQQS